MMTDADVLIVGGGIAGWSAAWFAAQRGRAVTLVDEGVDRASDLPVALVNPLRGHAGRLIARGVDGMHATFAMVDALRRRGHAIRGERGLWRPLVDRSGESSRADYWQQRLEGRLAFDWYARAPASLGLVDPVATLFIRDAGWIAPGGLLAALAAEASPTRIAGRVVRMDATSATLADETTIRARTALWCGGARGAAGFDGDGAACDAVYKPGSLLASATPLTTAPMSFGLYAVPWAERGHSTLIGPTREGTHARFPDDAVATDDVAHLEQRIARTFGVTTRLEPIWRGVRLARLSSGASRALAGVATLTALGSRGYLMAPLLAEEWARSL